MKISDLLSKESILLNIKLNSKSEAIETLIELHQKAGNLKDKNKYKENILKREQQGTTAIGDGIAIPHAKSDAVKKAGLAAVTVHDGVDYNALDGKKSNIIFMIAAPNDGDFHLEVLSRLMVLLMDGEIRQKLLGAKTGEEFINIIDSAEEAKYPSNDNNEKTENTGYRVLAVTACPTGIAHTFMAAEALEKAGRDLNIPIKVETNGSGGAKNILTSEEIKNADAIIIAADKSVDMERFDGKKLISVKVSEGIKRPKELINKALSDEAKVYRSSGVKKEEALGSDESFGRKLYKHLMNGVSNMLPFVVAGGIFIAIAFLIDSILGAPQDGNFGSNTPVAAFFKTIGSAAFNFMIPILAGYIGKSIADRPGLLVGIVGGFLATTGATFSNVAGDIPSGFLGALFAGFAGGYVMLGIMRLCDGLPNSLAGIKPILIYPILGLGAIAVIMCAVNPFMGYINTGLTNFLNSMGGTSKVFLGFVLGAMMAIDMGGPFNKAAYVFGTAAISSGNYDIMAAVMIGGMVPPLAIALATTFFKSKFTEEEIKSGPVNYIMGLSFITEGAIPYAASDPLRVIPACIVGSGIAGALSMFFGCTLMAPHGGIFVFAVVGNWLFYLLSLIVGSVAGMGLLAVLKKNINKGEY